jgi:hypothetical protein
MIILTNIILLKNRSRSKLTLVLTAKYTGCLIIDLICIALIIIISLIINRFLFFFLKIKVNY